MTGAIAHRPGGTGNTHRSNIMKNARTIRTLNRCGIPSDQIGFAGHTPSGKAIRRLERKDHRAHICAKQDVQMLSLPRTPESTRGFRAVQNANKPSDKMERSA